MNPRTAGADRSLAPGLLARSFLVQASWNFQGMQNLGFLTMTLPALRLLAAGRGEEVSGEEAAAQAGFFNAHPYLGAALAGLSLDLRRRTADTAAFVRQQGELTEPYMGPFGALGDHFFWATLLPACGCLAVLLAMSGLPIAGAFTLLVLYNLFHLYVRTGSLLAGLRGEESLLDWVRRTNLRRMAAAAGWATVMLSSLLPAGWTLWASSPSRALNQPLWVLFPASYAILVLAMGLLRRLDPRRTALLFFAVAMLLAHFLVVTP